MRDPDEEYLMTEREGRDRDRYDGFTHELTTGLNFSDLTLKEEVGEALTFHEDLDSSQIEVDVRNGVVTLLGEVDSQRGFQLAFDCASDVDGVITVINQLWISSSSDDI